MPQSIPEIRGPIMSERAVPKAIVPRIEKHPKAKRARVCPRPQGSDGEQCPGDVEAGQAEGERG